MDLPERIKRARLAAGYDVAARFARAIGVEPHTLWRWENAKMRPSDSAQVRIAEAAGVSIPWLRHGEGRMRVAA